MCVWGGGGGGGVGGVGINGLILSLFSLPYSLSILLLANLSVCPLYKWIVSHRVHCISDQPHSMPIHVLCLVGLGVGGGGGTM